MGNLFRERGEVDRALRVHQNVIARSNLNAKQKQKAMYALGQDFFAAGMLDRSESVFQELLDSTNTKWVTKSAICDSLRIIFEQTQEWQKAIDATECTRKNKKNGSNLSRNFNYASLISHYYCELADEALGKGNLHEVDSFIKKARKTYKQSTRLMTLEGDIALHQKQYKNALKHYNAAIKQDSRLLSMLHLKLEETAKSAGGVPSLQKNLLSLYKKNKDKSFLGVILVLAKKYGSNDELNKLIQSVMTDEKLNLDSIYKASNFLIDGDLEPNKALHLVNDSLSNYIQGAPAFVCVHCGYKMHDYLWRCPACNHWDTIDQA